MVRKSKAQRGLTLIEAMVALLVLSIGLVGIAALNLASVGAAHSAYYRTLASFIAKDAEERLWAELGLSGQASVESVLNDWRTNWADAMPELRLDLELSASSSGNVWQDFDVTVTWDERRFQGAVVEQFEYRARVVGPGGNNETE